MNTVDLKAQIKSRNLDSFYIFTGPEFVMLETYIKTMAKTFDAKIVRLDEVSELIKRLGAKSMLRKRQIYILRDNKDFLSSDELQAKFEHFRASESIVILVYTSIDKRSKLYKKFQDKIVQFDYMSEDVLVKYIQREIPLSNRNARRLVQICDRDYGRILLEIDKIRSYTESCEDKDNVDCPHDLSFEQLCGDGVIYQSPQDRIFDFVDAVLNCKPKKSFEIYSECKEFGESTFVMLINLYNNAKRVLQYQTCTSKDIEKATGMTSQQIYHAKNKSGVYSDEDLIYLMKLIQKCDTAIKTGTIEEDIAVPYMLTMFWS